MLLTLCLLFFACCHCALVSLLYFTSYSCCPLTCLLILLNSTLYLSLPITSVKFLKPVAVYLGLLASKISYFLPLPIFTFFTLNFLFSYLPFFTVFFIFTCFPFCQTFFHVCLPPTSVSLLIFNFPSFFSYILLLFLITSFPLLPLTFLSPIAALF